MKHNEDTRVKIPAILHLCRLGYTYLPLKISEYDPETNIFKNIFFDSITKINFGIEKEDISRLYDKICLILDNEDLGKEFYEMLLKNEIKLIDFENVKNNSFHVVTELTYKNGDDEFRPDITLLINGMPLAFIEVKKPNNKEGILAERKRINTRFQNKKFRRFINLTQILVFSNNMEYDLDSIEQLQGAYYSSTSDNKVIFNAFKEDKNVEFLDIEKLLQNEKEEVENIVLKDNNLHTIKHTPEFITNKNPYTPTNKILTSIFSIERLAMFLRYGIAYVKEYDGVQKHIMRYPQFFATKAIKNKLEQNIKKGIIWHTQGSGKTALAFYNIRYLTDYFQKKYIVPKFYFIVDRLDLLKQAKREFSARGLMVHTVNSKEELVQDFQTNKSTHNLKGELEITVVNIQKFLQNIDILPNNLFNINIQRVYFIDEAHRSYSPQGSFLGNLVTSDREAIIIALTGTPLIGEDKNSKVIFGDYIHKYYYNASIADGYTLKLIREEIETGYKMELEQALSEIQVLKGDVEKKAIYAHEKFVDPMLKYIVEDFEKSRVMYGDDSIGAMVVCDSADQAKKMFDIFQEKYINKQLKASLILHDIDDKQTRNDNVEDFKQGKIDFIFVFQMLLTGFDAKRLKKLYIGRVIKKHNLLQTLTRVNRPYKDFQYGYVVDFADISKEFDATNKAYFDELQSELGDEIKNYSNIFISKEEIEYEIKNIKDKLFYFNLKNAEEFSRQIIAIEDKQQILEIKKALMSAKNLYNIIRFMGEDALIEKLDFKKLTLLYNEVENRLNLIHFQESLENKTDTTNILNIALEDIIFTFRKVSEAEMVISDKLKNTLKKTRQAMVGNFDPKDPQFITLYDELKRLFNQKNLDEITQEEMNANIKDLERIYEKITEINRINDLLKAKCANDEKFVRIGKRLMEATNIGTSNIFETLMDIKQQADQKVLDNARIMDNEEYFIKSIGPIVSNGFKKHSIEVGLEDKKRISQLVTKEYFNQFNNIIV